MGFRFIKGGAEFGMGFTPKGRYEVLLSPQEMAGRLGVTVDTLGNWVKRGVIPSPLQAPNGTSTGRGRGRRWMKYDCWRVMRWLDGYRDD